MNQVVKHFVLSGLFALVASACTAKRISLGPTGTIPPRPAGATYPGWEYYCAGVDGSIGYRDAIVQLLSDAGKQGWELLFAQEIVGMQYCFKRPLADGAGAATAAAGADPLDALWASGITKLADNRYDITRDAFERMYTNMERAAGGARIAEWTEAGKVRGFVFEQVPPGSPLARLGLVSGDAVDEINGFQLTTADQAFGVLYKLRGASALELEVTRAGKPLTLRYAVVTTAPQPR